MSAIEDLKRLDDDWSTHCSRTDGGVRKYIAVPDRGHQIVIELGNLPAKTKEKVREHLEHHIKLLVDAAHQEVRSTLLESARLEATQFLELNPVAVQP